MYSELVYFEGAHFAHIVARAERQRLQAIWLNSASTYFKHRPCAMNAELFQLANRQPSLRIG
jgi:hypothetical protein